MAAVLQSVVWSNTWEQLKLFSKRCCICGQRKDFEAFALCSRAPDGRQYQCRSCRADYDRRRKLFVIVPNAQVVVRLQWKPPAVNIHFTSSQPMEAIGS